MRMRIRRQYLLGDSVDAVMSLSRRDLRKLWRFEFIGEEGIDAGGLAREWFELVCREIFDPDTGLWTSSATNQMSMTINPASGECATVGPSQQCNTMHWYTMTREGIFLFCFFVSVLVGSPRLLISCWFVSCWFVGFIEFRNRTTQSIAARTTWSIIGSSDA